jgi:phosphoribosylformylglycinamidine cyclo-ligase
VQPRDTFVEELGQTVGDALLQTHLSYLPALGPLLDSGIIRGLAHITGGGLLENIPRILPAGTAVEIRRGSWPVLPVFEIMQRAGNVAESEMFRTFNMGIGMVIVCAPGDAAAIQNSIKPAYEIGRVTRGDRNVALI